MSTIVKLDNVFKTYGEGNVAVQALKRVNLEGANITDAQLCNLFATDCIMRRVNLTGANLSNAVLGGTIMRNANVTNADFEGVELATVTMAFSNFSKALNAKIPDYKKDLR